MMTVTTNTTYPKYCNLYLNPFFVVLQISHKNRIQLKKTEEEKRKLEAKEDVGAFAFAQKDHLLFRQG